MCPTPFGAFLVALGLALNITSIVLRAVLYDGRKIKLELKYYGIMGISLLGTFSGLFGFLALSNGEIDSSKNDYSQILTILSLLAAAIVTGFFLRSHMAMLLMMKCCYPLEYLWYFLFCFT